jgi:hypothetical protein
MNIAQIGRKKRWSAEDGQAVVDAWRRSGQSSGEFARRHGIAEVRLLRWSTRIVELPAFVPVVVKGGEPANETHHVEVVLTSGVVVRTAAGTPAAWLAELVRALEKAPC